MPGLKHYWKLGETGSGARADSAGSVTLSPVATLSNAIGKNGNGASFDGTDWLLNTFTENPPWTIAAWIKKTSFTTLHGLFDISDDVTSLTGAQVTVSASGIIQTRNVTDGVIVSDAITSGDWHLIVFKLSADGQHALSVDGRPFKLGNATVMPSTNSRIHIGHTPSVGGTSRFIGLIDEAAMWTISLSQSNVTDLYNRGVGTFLA